MKMPLLKLSVDNLSHVAEVISRKLSQLSSVCCVCFYKQIINKQRSEALNMANNAANLLTEYYSVSIYICEEVSRRSHFSILIRITMNEHFKRVLELLLTSVISYISASSRNEKILQLSDESDNVDDDIKSSPLNDNQRSDLTLIANHGRNRRNL